MIEPNNLPRWKELILMESLALFGFQHYLYFQRCQIQIKLTNWDRYLLARIVNNNTVSRFADILIIKRNYSLLDVGGRRKRNYE